MLDVFLFFQDLCLNISGKLAEVKTAPEQLFLVGVLDTVGGKHSQISLLRALEIKTTSLLRPAFASQKCQFPSEIIFDINTFSLIRPLEGRPKGSLNGGIGFIYWLAGTCQTINQADLNLL